MADHGRLMYDTREAEGQARLHLEWVRDATRTEHLDLLQDWVADLKVKYDACLLRLPNWHAMTWKDRPAINALITEKVAAEKEEAEKGLIHDARQGSILP